MPFDGTLNAWVSDIGFSGPMIRALLDDLKTNTRRLAWGKLVGLDVDDDEAADLSRRGWKLSGPDDTEHRIGWQPSRWQRIHREVQAGRRVILWVRENFATPFARSKNNTGAIYAADADDYLGQMRGLHRWGAKEKGKWTPFIHMPRYVSRITLEVTGSKIERLQEISRSDAIAEGLRLASAEIEEFFRWPQPRHERLWLSPPAAFEWLWNEIHGKGSWDANPEVVALTFKVHKQNIDSLPKQEAA